MEMNTALAMLQFAADPADRLPTAARTKLVVFREAKALAAAGMGEVADRIDWQRTRKQEAEQRLRSLKENHRIGPDSPHESAREARERRDAARIEIERLQKIHDARAADWRTIARLVDNLEKWIKAVHANTKITEYVGPPPTLGRLPPARSIEKYRSEFERLRGELEQADRAPLPSAQLKEMARRQVAELRERGRPNLAGFIRSDADGKRAIEFPTTTTDVRANHRAMVGIGEVVDALALTAWLFPERLVERLDAEIDRKADDAHALTDEQRAARKLELTAALLEAERGEEAAIEAAAGEGTIIDRRENADPRAVLTLSEKLPPPPRD